MNKLVEKLDYPYGDHFKSYQELERAISQRHANSVTDLRGSAVVWIDQKPYPKRVGVLVLSSGELCFSHAENI